MTNLGHPLKVHIDGFAEKLLTYVWNLLLFNSLSTTALCSVLSKQQNGALGASTFKLHFFNKSYHHIQIS